MPTDAPQIVDPDAVMPAGWLEGEPTHLLDEGVPKPRDWDDARDGVWMPPEVRGQGGASSRRARA
jgi:hypothetical protein